MVTRRGHELNLQGRCVHDVTATCQPAPCEAEDKEELGPQPRPPPTAMTKMSDVWSAMKASAQRLELPMELDIMFVDYDVHVAGCAQVRPHVEGYSR